MIFKDEYTESDMFTIMDWERHSHDPDMFPSYIYQAGNDIVLDPGDGDKELLFTVTEAEQLIKAIRLIVRNISQKNNKESK